MRRALEVFGVALRLGLTSFGGPSAHLGYFRTEYVERRRWLDDATFAEVVGVAQFLPGPTSSQVGATIGFLRAGPIGALAAWLGFTVPSALALAGFAAVSGSADVTGAVWLQALKLVAVAVVLDAVLAMARTLARTVLTACLAVAVGIALLVLPRTGPVQLGCLAVAAVVGLLLAPREAPDDADRPPMPIRRRAGAVLLAVFAVLTTAVLALPSAVGGRTTQLAGAAYRAGTLVFGGGHVVLPLLRSSTVPGLLDDDRFLAGYGAAQAVPGPLFTLAAFLGQEVSGPLGAVAATLATFLPGMLLMFGVLPFWNALRRRPRARAALIGVNAAVVGLLAAALIDPIAGSTIHSWLDLGYAATLFGLLRLTPARPLHVVVLALAASPLLGLG